MPLCVSNKPRSTCSQYSLLLSRQWEHMGPYQVPRAQPETLLGEVVALGLCRHWSCASSHLNLLFFFCSLGRTRMLLIKSSRTWMKMEIPKWTSKNLSSLWQLWLAAVTNILSRMQPNSCQITHISCLCMCSICWWYGSLHSFHVLPWSLQACWTVKINPTELIPYPEC